jgi:hypothetical protein
MPACANITAMRTVKKFWNLEPWEPDPLSHQSLYDGGEEKKIPVAPQIRTDKLFLLLPGIVG